MGSEDGGKGKEAEDDQLAASRDWEGCLFILLEAKSK